MGRRTKIGVAALLLLLAVATYWPVRGHDFVNYDDDDYVTENATVQQGLNAETLRWAWTSTEAANWHPLTWVSHLTDVELFGLDPGRHHMTNVGLHALATLLLFMALGALSGGWWRSALVAALFCVHPMHVQSVAWIAERKDVLSGVFWMAALWAYASYARRPTPARYLVVFCIMGLGLMAKPMLVTLPFVLLLLDVWPLRRERSWSRLILEKLPLLALAIASSIVTVVAQSGGQGFSSPLTYGLGVRVANALSAYGTYVGKLFAPTDLAVFYPHPGSDFHVWRVAAGVAILLGVSAVAWWKRENHTYILVGWLWFVGTLAPVIGLLQVGGQAMADRYTYLPYVGAFIALVWGGAALLERFAPPRTALAAIAILPVTVLAFASRSELTYWKNTETLFERAIAVTGANHIARINLAEWLGQQGRPEDALVHLRAALDDYPNSIKAHYNTGVALSVLGRHEEARPYFERTVAAEPEHVEAHMHLGAGDMRAQRYGEANAHFELGSKLTPNDPEVHFNLGVAQSAQGRWQPAALNFRRALALRPDYARAHFELSQALFGAGQYASALEELRLARRHGHAVPDGMLERLAQIVARGGQQD